VGTVGTEGAEAMAAHVRLVLAERQRLFVDSLAAVLAWHGFDVAALATSPQELLATVARLQPDICLLAAGFPGDGDLDLLQIIGERHPSVKVVLFSASPDLGAMAAALKGGAVGFIPSDHHVADILDALCRVRNGEQVFDLMDAGICSLRPAAATRRNELWDFLTLRERQVLMLMMDGECTRQIARSLAISVSTARTHVENVLLKLGVHSRLEATTVIARARPPSFTRPAGQVARPG
jgi:two-component system, NarL family, nitrate/nitrite response regulator NarL